jgi:hypothetical protein
MGCDELPLDFTVMHISMALGGILHLLSRQSRDLLTTTRLSVWRCYLDMAGVFTLSNFQYRAGFGGEDLETLGYGLRYLGTIPYRSMDARPRHERRGDGQTKRKKAEEVIMDEDTNQPTTYLTRAQTSFRCGRYTQCLVFLLLIHVLNQTHHFCQTATHHQSTQSHVTSTRNAYLPPSVTLPCLSNVAPIHQTPTKPCN